MKKWLINLEKTILWQYDKATRLTRVLLSKENWYKQNVTNFIVGFLIDIFNLKTANDFGLSVWGKILNFPRQLMPNKYITTILNRSGNVDTTIQLDRTVFNAKIASGDDFNAITIDAGEKYTFVFYVTVGSGYYVSVYDANNNLIVNKAPIQSQGGTAPTPNYYGLSNYSISSSGIICSVVTDYTPINLTTEQYRFLLLGQVLKFKMSCTIPEINRYLRIIFNEQDNRNVYVTDNHNLTITYTLEPQVLSDEIKALIENYDFLPRPAGVKALTGVGDYFTFKIIPSPANADVTLIVNGRTYNTKEIEVNSGQDVTYTVSDTAHGFQSQTATVTVTQYTEVPVSLETTLTITAVPNTASISLTIDGNTYTGTGTITKTVTYGNIYSWTISNSGYYTETSGGNLTVTELVNTEVTLNEDNINLVFDKLFKNNGGVESKGTFIVQRAGSYHIELGGDAGYDENYPNQRSNGGTADITTTLAVDDEIEIKVMYGGYDSSFGTIFGGVGVGLWVNGVCKLVAGGGGRVAGQQVVSCGGGGYNGGKAYYKNRFAENGYSIDGTKGNYQNTEAGAGQFHNPLSYANAYGGSGYKSSDYNSAVLVYAGNTGAGYARITYIG